MAKLHSRIGISQHLLHWHLPFALLALLCSAFAANVSSLTFDLNEQNLRSKKRSRLIPQNEFPLEMISSLLDENLERPHTHTSWRRDEQVHKLYLNRKTKRKDLSKAKRYLVEDDELFFDSNGMPIQGMDDDDDDASVGVEEVQANQAAVIADTDGKAKQMPHASEDAAEPAITADETKQLPAASATENKNKENKNEQKNKNEQMAKLGGESKEPNKLPLDLRLPSSQEENQITKQNSGQSSQPNESASSMADADTDTDTTVKAQQEMSTNKPSVVHNTKLFNNTHHHSTDDSRPADTIFDDILRGFSFAFLFCICIICLHKTCWYTCIRCGIFPDDRVVEARWRRFQMKNKRAYFNPRAPPPMDSKSLGKWFDQRDRMHPDGYAGIWDSSAERSVGSWDEDSAGAIDFDDDGIQLSTWDKDDASSTVELEYGEGDELEDMSHDERLFDVEDGGAGIVKQANKFFDRNVRKQPFTMKNIMQNSNKEATDNESGPLQKLSVEVKNDVSDDAFFDALEPPSGRVDAFSPGATPGNKTKGSLDAKDFLQEQANIQVDNSTGTGADFNDSYQVDDRGYDEESDLLGLRSDSPPPLDLEEIEKKLRENMEKTQSYYPTSSGGPST